MHAMSNPELEPKNRKLIRSINWWVFVSCGIAGFGGVAALLWLRAAGQLPPDDYTYPRIVLHSLAIGVLMPIFLATAFYLTAIPSMKVWLERLGAFILFFVLPAVLIFGIAQWIAGE